MQGELPGMSFGFSSSADVRGSILSEGFEGMRVSVDYRGLTEMFSIPWIGDFNASNFLAAVAAGLHLGASLRDIQFVFSKIPSIPGRLEKVSGDSEVQVFVDFAHTGEALSQVLAALKKISRGKLFVVFGCGGGRDPGRRKGMAAAAEQWADLAMITVDNARDEEPQAICQEILSGFKSQTKVVIELDRKRAIQRTVAEAKPGDVVCIAGKGHECFQIIGSHAIPFDDREVAREALRYKSCNLK